MPANTPRGYTYPFYTDLTDFPAQIQDLATDIDTDVQNRYDLIAAALEAQSVRLTKSVSQTIASGVNVNVIWNTEVTDNDAMADLAVDNTRIQIQTPGTYLISGHVQFGGGAAGGVSVVLTSSGAVSPITLGASKALDNDKDTSISWTTLHWSPVTPDNIVVVARQNSGGNISATAGSFTATRVA